jgi:hypothetical protein
MEVLFSSVLSYLINPKNDHGLNSKFLKLFASGIFNDVSEHELENAIVTPEKNLGFRTNWLIFKVQIISNTKIPWIFNMKSHSFFVICYLLCGFVCELPCLKLRP